MNTKISIGIICLAAVVGCTDQYPRPMYDQQPIGPTVEIEFPSVEPASAKEAIPVVKLGTPLQPEKILSVRGCVQNTNKRRTPVLIEIKGSGANGKPMTFRSGFAQLVPEEGNSSSYHLNLHSPDTPGKYQIEASLFGRWVGRGEIVVEKARR